MKCASCIAALVLQATSALACRAEHEHPRVFTPPSSELRKRQATQFPPVLTEHEAILTGSFDNVSIEGWNYYYAHTYHIAGTNEGVAQWTADRWAEYGWSSKLDTYYTYLNYPVSSSVVLSYGNGSTFVPALIEDSLPEDDVTNWPNKVPAFHGYSFTGDAEAEYVYVGRGQQVDFDRLLALNVSLEGKIALARYGGPFRGLKVKNAQDNGMIGALIFTDTADDGNVTEANGYAAYPDGPARHPTAIQRGSVMFLSTYPGDPTTPGYASKEGVPRGDISRVTPRIPSLPLSWKDAQPLIQALDGFGVDGETVNRTNWVGALNATYSTGPAPGVTVAMSNVMQSNITAIWDAIAVINGTCPDEAIIIGNHRDAWIIGGAADPNSGSAVLIELAKAFGELLKTGWQPKRTIVLGSWDAEEYGLLGSTEWVEEFLPWLTASTVAYLNLDIATTGPDPELSATPDLHDIALETMKQVVYPYRGYDNLTLYDVWYGLTEGEVGVLGSGSDYTAFLHNGISSLDMSSGGNTDTDPVYPYHTNYDTWYWMTTFGDPDYVQHRVMGQWLALLAYRLATDEIIPFNVENYGIAMTSYLADLTEILEEAEVADVIDLSALEAAIETFNASASAMTAAIASASSPADIDSINQKLKLFSRGFVSQGGLPNREFYKHVVFAPGLDTGYAPVEWPGVTEAITFESNTTLAQLWVAKSAAAVQAAAGILRP